MATSTVEKVGCVVIGGGLAGLNAARELEAAGVKCALLEASSRLGGRLHSVQTEEQTFSLLEDADLDEATLARVQATRPLELGAEWHHGTVLNPLFDYAVAEGLYDTPRGRAEVKLGDVFNAGGYESRLSDGTVADEAAFMAFQERWWELTDREDAAAAPSIDAKTTVLEHLRSEFLEKAEAEAGTSTAFLEAAFGFQHRFQCLYDGCDSLAEMTIGGFQHYHSLSGPNVRVPGGYSSIPASLASKLSLSDGCVRLRHRVTSVEWGGGSAQGKVVVNCAPSDDGAPAAIFECDCAIVTLSLGVLKENAVGGAGTNLFYPPLPEEKVAAIQKLGFGTVDKVFVRAKSPASDLEDEQAAQAAPRPYVRLLRPFPEDASCWTDGIVGFGPSSGGYVCAWLSGPWARAMEALPEQTVLEDFRNLVKRVTGEDWVAQVSEAGALPLLVRSTWHSNELFRGSYTYMRGDAGPRDVAALAEPLCVDGVPRVCFAGEATDPRFFSTAHGAFASGAREAARVVASLKKQRGGVAPASAGAGS